MVRSITRGIVPAACILLLAFLSTFAGVPANAARISPQPVTQQRALRLDIQRITADITAPDIIAAAASRLLDVQRKSARAVSTAAYTAAQLSAFHAFHMGHLAHLAHERARRTLLLTSAAQSSDSEGSGDSDGTPAPVVKAPPVSHGDGDSDSDDGSSAPVPTSSDSASHSAPVSNSGGGYTVGSSFQACVIRAESGGNPNIWNASGHWGLYQFSASTWAMHGGDPSLFGNASAAYQTQIFWNTVKADGTSDWAPYDGC
jgi:hypothetical protein